MFFKTKPMLDRKNTWSPQKKYPYKFCNSKYFVMFQNKSIVFDSQFVFLCHNMDSD